MTRGGPAAAALRRPRGRSEHTCLRPDAHLLLPLQGLGRKLRTAFGFLYGWMGLPLPRRHPLYMATGRPVPVPKVGAGPRGRRRSCLLPGPDPGRVQRPLPHAAPARAQNPLPPLCARCAQGSPGDPDFEAKVDATHALVVAELQALYDRRKEEFGWKDRPLSIE
jgi:hypothetical protein